MASCKRKRERAAKRLTKITRAFGKMLLNDAIYDVHEGTGYMGGVGVITNVVVTTRGEVTITIETEDEPAKWIDLRLVLSYAERP